MDAYLSVHSSLKRRFSLSTFLLLVNFEHAILLDLVFYWWHVNKQIAKYQVRLAFQCETQVQGMQHAHCTTCSMHTLYYIYRYLTRNETEFSDRIVAHSDRLANNTNNIFKKKIFFLKSAICHWSAERCAVVRSWTAVR